MRRIRDIEGGAAGRLRWVFGAPFRIARRSVAPTREALRRGRAARLARGAAAAADRRWRAAVRTALRSPADVETVFGEVSKSSLPVIMCLWNRPERIDDILRLLGAQRSGPRLRLMLWNNAPEHDAHYRGRIATFGSTSPAGALESIEYVSSPRNLGGFARFFLARHARRQGTTSTVFAMLDDDQDVTPDFVAALLEQGGAARYAGVWAWRYLADTHWDRVPAEVGEEADYVGTGGSICDLAVVDDDRFFTGLPSRFAFLEDQWLSAYARGLGWHLRKVDTPVEFVLHETNQFHGMAELKTEFRRYLDAAEASAESPR